MFDESGGSLFVQGHISFLGFGWFGFQGFDLLKILLDAGQFGEDGMIFGVDAMETKVRWKQCCQQL